MVLSNSTKSRLTLQHETVLELLEGKSEDQLKQRPIADKWSPFENVAHLGAYQPAFIQRLERILKEDEPPFQRYRAEDDPQFYVYLDLSLLELESDIIAKRKMILGMVEKFTDEQMDRAAHHPRFGRLSISDWLEFFLLHEAHHLYTIYSLIHAAN
jgi:hypothetical protein